MDAAELRDLVAVYDRPVEGSRLAVLDAIREHGGDEAALQLAGSGDADERWLAARLMHLLREPRYPAALEPLVEDSDPATARSPRGMPSARSSAATSGRRSRSASRARVIRSSACGLEPGSRESPERANFTARSTRVMCCSSTPCA